MSETTAYDADLVIIGGGPSGQAAALTAVRHGLRVTVIDEQERPGGQILRQPPMGFTVRSWLADTLYNRLKDQLREFENNRNINWRGRSSVLGILPLENRPGYKVIVQGQAQIALASRRVLIAAGAYDLPVPLPGWTLPGVFAAGAVQAFIKSQQLVPGEKIVLTGTHPLQLLVAKQIVEAGGHVEAVVFAQSFAHMVKAVLDHPLAALRNLPNFILSLKCILALKRHKVPVFYEKLVQRVNGSTRVESITFADGTTIDCDRVALCFGFVPQADLLRATGARVYQNGRTGGWQAEHDDWMHSSLPDLYVAGETTGVAGAEVAICEGHIAGLSIVKDAGKLSAVDASHAAAPHRSRRKRLLGFTGILDEISSPKDYLPKLPDPETIICRCEDVRVKDLLRLLSEPVAPVDVSSLKLVSRAGMGLCQGRSCEQAVMRIMQEHCPDRPQSTFKARFPARPTQISELCK